MDTARVPQQAYAEYGGRAMRRMQRASHPTRTDGKRTGWNVRRMEMIAQGERIKNLSVYA